MKLQAPCVDLKMELEMAHPSGEEETTIANLPVELLSAILSYLACNDHLVQVALVSKRFKDVIEEFLYRSVVLNVVALDKDQGCWMLALGNTTGSYRLFEDLTQNPN